MTGIMIPIPRSYALLKMKIAKTKMKRKSKTQAQAKITCEDMSEAEDATSQILQTPVLELEENDRVAKELSMKELELNSNIGEL